MITHCFPLYNTLCDLGICLEGAAGDAVLAAGEVEARRIDRLLNRYSPVSALSRLSREYRPHVPYAVDGVLWGVLAVCERFRQLTGGAFHMATGSISDLWDFGGTAPRRPPPEQLREQVDKIARCRIDMDREEDKERLLKYLRDLCRKDHVKTVVVDITPLNLVEITRKKTKRPLYEQAGRGRKGAAL